MGRYEEVMARAKNFMNDRFGMFIHYGLYSVAARHEWIKHLEKITDEDYQKYFDNFTAEHFEPKKWAKAAKEAGMKYAVLTTKHHEGFCLFDSQYTDYKATNTKAGRDLVREYVDAFRAEGLKIGFYYSLIDWHHPDFPHETDRLHPMRGNKNYPDDNRDFSRYTEYLRNQVKELLTNYGKIDIMWFDFSYDNMTGEKWEATKLVKMIRELQPDIMIDNRLEVNHAPDKNFDNMPFYGGDFFSPEQFVPDKPMRDDQGRIIPWEECLTTQSQSWGYVAGNHEFMSSKDIIRTLVDCVSKGGNLLLNVGPNGKGEFPKEIYKIFSEVGEWMKENKESIYGCGFSEIPQPYNGRITQNGNQIYLHLFEKSGYYIRIEGIEAKDVLMAINLDDNSEVAMSSGWFADLQKSALMLKLPAAALANQTDTVIKIILKNKV